MYTLPEIGFPLLDRPPVEAVGAPNPVEAFELIRLSIWANADEAPKASTDASATVAKFMLFPEATDQAQPRKLAARFRKTSRGLFTFSRGSKFPGVQNYRH
jgi:hypothetical protein